ncbi:MAG: L-threonylcarbamoyladenylate synthase type 1 TsaC, partial [Serratia symbiotica]|nr:L-threonylcarbamoyladenylate synthase type 1 TsaC [Serratia symbiotica]
MNSEHTASLAYIIDALHNQKVIAYPTEAVFGLGCDPDSEKAVNTLLSLKQRSWEKGLIVIAANYQQLIPYINDRELSEPQRAAICASWPGPVTWAIPSRPETPRFLTGRFNSLAVRVSAHPLVQKLCQQY